MPKTTRFPWGPAAAAATVLVVAAAALLRLPVAPPAGPPRAPLPTVSLTRLDQAPSSVLLNEKLALDDPRQLFMPADVNRTQALLPGARPPEAGVPAAAVRDQELFFSAESLAGGGALAVQFSEPVPAPANATDALQLTERPDAPLTLGRADDPAAKTPVRTGWVEAVATGSGRVVWSGALAGSGPVPVGDWEPLELLGAVAPEGLAGNLVVNRSSGSDNVDGQIRQNLMQTLRVGQRLPPGFYTFRVGP